jgi:hypothetical protein
MSKNIKGHNTSFDIRYSFAAQFLSAAATQSSLARHIEGLGNEISIEQQSIHRGFVVGAIMQAVAALEAEAWELLNHGPGHHLGSNGEDKTGKQLLFPLADTIERCQILERYSHILHLLKGKKLPLGVQPYQDTSLVVRLRNDIVHYKSRWGSELERAALMKSLKSKGFPRPPFIPNNTNFFPHQCLGAACAEWAATTCVKFINDFHSSLGIPSPLANYQERLNDALDTTKVIASLTISP